MESMFQMVTALFSGINILVWLIGIGTLLSGRHWYLQHYDGNRERTHHRIGVRRAIGARPAQILMQILTESAILTLLAGLTGIVVAVLILVAAESGIGGNFPSLPRGVSSSLLHGTRLGFLTFGLGGVGRRRSRFTRPRH